MPTQGFLTICVQFQGLQLPIANRFYALKVL